jgi:hypothetical protein
MEFPPKELDGAEVVYYVILSNKHRWTGVYKHFADGQLIGSVPALAICQYAGKKEAYLFHCDHDWEVTTDDLFASVDEAMEQAAAQYDGLGNEDWIKVSK